MEQVLSKCQREESANIWAPLGSGGQGAQAPKAQKVPESKERAQMRAGSSVTSSLPLLLLPKVPPQNQAKTMC